MMKKITVIALVGCMILTLCACGGSDWPASAEIPEVTVSPEPTEAPAVQPLPTDTPAETAGESPEPADEPSEEEPEVTDAGDPSQELPDGSTEKADASSEEPSAVSEETAPDDGAFEGADEGSAADRPVGELLPAETEGLSEEPEIFTGEDGSVLTMESDGSCTYEVFLTGTVNGLRSEGRVVFHGRAEDGVFTFEKVTWYGLDVTQIARASGYTTFTYWEKAAAQLCAAADEP